MPGVPEAASSALLAFAKGATETLAVARSGPSLDLESVRLGLRDALDAGRILSLANDRGVVLSTDSLLALEALLRETLAVFVPLEEAEAELVKAGKGAIDDRSALYVINLRSRSLNSAMAIQKGLEGAYRGLAESRTES
ncbi:MAG: hypothetical protein HYV07_25280 [Deltaproteobacteria bacterium]|nr:hypothetical protein [Deltaproteobacteria bacterium]